jgi:hypothetical protein
VDRHLLTSVLRANLDRLLAELDQLPVAAGLPLELCRGNGQYRVAVVLTSDGPAGHGPRPQPDVPDPVVVPNGPIRLRRIHRQLLAKATSEPVPSKRLIASCGYEYNSYSIEAVTTLCRARLLIRTPDGIVKPA